jgi:hypothetical protein
MKTTFDTIDKSVNAFVDNIDPSQIPESLREKCQTFIGGFPITDNDKVRAAQSSIKAKQSGYVTDRMAVKKKLEERGVKAKAFIPLRIWEKICKEHSLFQMRPDDKNNIRIRVASEIIVQEMIFGTIIAMAITVLCIASYLTVGLYRSGHNYDIMDCLGAFAVTSALGAVAIVLISGIVFGMFETPTSRLQIWLYTKFASRKKMLLHFMPDFKEIAGGYFTRLMLPQAPASVQATLAKLTGYRALYVAAVPEAIAFDRSFNSILQKDNSVKIQERMASRDPIIYDIEGSCVAIIEQFGDFPIEQKIVDDLLTREFLL